PRKTASAISSARPPLTRSTASPALPGAVAMAAMVSSSAPCITLPVQTRLVVSSAFGIVGGRDRQTFDHAVAERIGLDPRVLAQRDMDDAALLRVQVLGHGFVLLGDGFVGELAREPLQLFFAPFP